MVGVARAIAAVASLSVQAFWPYRWQAGCPEDPDGDGTVGIIDFLILLAHWGPC